MRRAGQSVAIDRDRDKRSVYYFTLLIITFSRLFSVRDRTFSHFQINSSTHQQQTVTEYAKPNQGISYSHQETTIHRDQLDSMLGLWPTTNFSYDLAHILFIFEILFLFICLLFRKSSRKHESSRSYHNTKRLLQRLRQANRWSSDHCFGPYLASRALYLQPLLLRIRHT